MEYSYSFREVINALGPSYRSVDLRAILVSLGDGHGWRSVASIIRFSRKTPEQVSEEHTKLKQDLGLTSQFLERSLAVEDNERPFRGMNLELSSFDFDQFDQVVARWSEGRINAHNRAFQLWDEIAGSDLLSQRMTWRGDPYAMDYDVWPAYYLGLGERSTTLVSPDGQGGLQASVKEDDLNIWARQEAFSTFRDIYDQVLKAPYGQGNRLEIRAPIYARIDEVLHLRTTLMARGSCDRQLAKVFLESSLQDHVGSHHGVTPPRMLGRRDISLGHNNGDTASFEEQFQLEALPEAGMATATLFTRRPARFDLVEKRVPLQSGLPFFSTFTSFVPEADLDEYLDRLGIGQAITSCRLYQRFSPKNGSKKIDELLEHVTNYLLGLCQLNPIPFSNPQYDVLSGDLSAGSADILAMTPEKEPLLVSCTMAMPDVKKSGMLLAARTAICRRFGWPEDRVKVLLVTGKPSAPQTDAATPTLAAEDLEQLWEMIKEGKIWDAWSLLGVGGSRYAV